MREPKAPGVEHEPCAYDGLALRISVDGIAQERTAEMFEVNADLVGAAGVEVAENEGARRIGALPEDVVVRDGGASGSGIQDGLFLPVDRVAADVGEDGAERLHRGPGGYGEIELGGGAGGELLEERLQGEVRFCCDEAAGGVLVEAVHNPGPLFPANSRQGSAAMMEERVYESAIGIAGGGMHDQTRRLVDDEKVVVLVENLERDLLRDHGGLSWSGQIDRNEVPLRNGGLGPRGRVIEKDVTRLQERLDAGTRQVGQVAGEEQVKPLVGILTDGDPHGWDLAERRGWGQGGCAGTVGTGVSECRAVLRPRTVAFLRTLHGGERA